MTVKELIEKLKEFPEEMEVMTGCSCSGHELQEIIVKAHLHKVYDKNDYIGRMVNFGDKVWLK